MPIAFLTFNVLAIYYCKGNSWVMGWSAYWKRGFLKARQETAVFFANYNEIGKGGVAIVFS